MLKSKYLFPFVHLLSENISKDLNIIFQKYIQLNMDKFNFEDVSVILWSFV